MVTYITYASTMNCVYCGHDTRVTNSRPQKRINGIWRRRLCSTCDAIFSTSEAVDYSKSFKFKRSSDLEPFSRDCLYISLYESLRHRKTAIDDASALTDTILQTIAARLTTAVVDRTSVITVATQILDRFDPAAATHYRAYHK